MTLIYIFYRLARHPEQLHKLQSELDALEFVSSLSALQHAQHLNGIINETMRLHPALLTGGLRETPPEGIMISGRFVPGNVVICSPRYIIGKRQYLRSCQPLYHANRPEVVVTDIIDRNQLNPASSEPVISYRNAGTVNREWSSKGMLTRLSLLVCLPLNVPFTRLHTNIDERSQVALAA